MKRIGGIVALLSTFAVAPMAHAEEPLDVPSLPARPVQQTWQKGALRVTFSYRDSLDGFSEKLTSGLPVTILLRALVFRQGSSEPTLATAYSCRIVYDLWDENYQVHITSSEGERDVRLLTQEGVIRTCSEARNLKIADRTAFRVKGRYMVAGIVDVNPISPQMLEQIRRWVIRPAGSAQTRPGDALFGTFVGLFLRELGTTDRTLRFRAASSFLVE